MPTVFVDNESELISAIPYVLGFHPHDSLVIIGFKLADSPHVQLGARIDLPNEGEEVRYALQLGQFLTQQDCDTITPVLITQRAPEPTDPAPHTDTAAAIAAVCDTIGVQLRAGHILWTPRIEAGQTWRCYQPCGCAGSLDDPATSQVAAATIAAGRITYASREELAAVIAPVADEVLTRRARLLADLTQPPLDAEQAVRLLSHWVTKAARETPTLTDHDVVALCDVLVDPLVRDAAFGFSLDHRHKAAIRLWTALTREAPAPHRAEPAVLLAIGAFLAGEGALASIALERSVNANPHHQLGRTLSAFFSDSRCTPDKVHALISDGTRQARELLGLTDTTRDLTSRN